MYSFIKPRVKKMLTTELLMVFSFFGITFFMIFATYGFLYLKTTQYKESMLEYDKKVISLKNEAAIMQNKIAYIEQEVSQAEQVYTKNSVLKESIKNLFDLIPERIVLSKVQMGENSLVLYGVTPSKDVYEFMLHAPLRSIFHRTYSDFYPISGGWYRFVSTNYLDEEESTHDNK